VDWPRAHLAKVAPSNDLLRASGKGHVTLAAPSEGAPQEATTRIALDLLPSGSERVADVRADPGGVYRASKKKKE